MQQILSSNSSETKRKVPDLNLIMELDQNIQGLDHPNALPRIESSSRVKSTSDGDQNSPIYPDS